MDDIIQSIYTSVDRLLRHGKFDECDRRLAIVFVRNYPTDLLLAWLVATLPAASKIPSRPVFREKVEAEIRRRGEWEDGILEGL